MSTDTDHFPCDSQTQPDQALLEVPLEQLARQKPPSAGNMPLPKMAECGSYLSCSLTYVLFFFGFHSGMLYAVPSLAYLLITLMVFGKRAV